MKKRTITLFCLFVICQMGTAQISLTSATAPNIRTGHRTREVDTTAAKALNVGVGGANQTWNFSTIALDPVAAILETFASPTGAPSAASFPTATLIKREGITNDKGVEYHRINTSEWVILGNVDSTGEASINPDPQTVFKYPFTFNSTFKDTFNYDDPDLGPIDFKTTTKGDAWGTIKTSLGTLNTIRATRTLAASLSFFGFPITIDGTISEWWTTQYSAPVFTHQRFIVNSPFGIDTAYTATVLTTQTVGTQEVEVNHIANAFPSPASTSVRLDIEIPTAAEVSALIVSMNGQTMKSRNFGGLQAGKQQINIDVTELATGTYQVILMSDKGKLGTQKIVVSH
jgi:Secretion system C-terminal sorting domain